MAGVVNSIPVGARVPGLKGLLKEAVSGYRSKVGAYEKVKGAAEAERDGLVDKLGSERRRGRRTWEAWEDGGGDKEAKKDWSIRGRSRAERWKKTRLVISSMYN